MAIKSKLFFWAVLIIIAVLHIFASAYHMPNVFENEPSAGAFGGMRLHYLKMWNFDFSAGLSVKDGTSHILDNFIKSATSGTHGLLDFLHWYIYIAVYTILGIPINEFWLLFAQTIVMISALLIICLLVDKVYDDRLAALIFMAIASQVYINYSRSFYIIPPNTLFEGLLLYALYIYNNRRVNLAFSFSLFVLLFINSASGNFIKLPLYLLFIWCANYKINGLSVAVSFRKFVIEKPSNLLFAIPVLAALAAHFYVYSRIGVSNLGMLGWISQKMGLSTPTFLKLILFRQSLEKFIFAKLIDWWMVIIISAFYGLAVFRGGRKIPLLLFPIVYYLYLINLEPHSATLAYIIFISIGISGMFSLAKGITETMVKRLSYIFILVLTAYTLVNLTGKTVYSAVTRPKPAPNCLKSIGFFLREHMARDDKIASLLSQTDNILNEYYYGKTFFKSPVFGKEIYDYKNLTEPQSANNPVSPNEVDREFPFYVIDNAAYKNDKNYAKFVDRLIKKYSLKKAADVADGSIICASVYSSRPIGSTRLNSEEANIKFDKKYANLKNLFYHHHVGVASTWGYY